MEWPVEEIPDEDALFYRVHYRDIDTNGKVKPGAFRNSPKVPGSGMSVNWDKYSTPQQAREGANQPAPAYAIVKLIVGRVRELPGQTVVHEPLAENQSHSEVFGEKSPEVRLKLLDMYEHILDCDLTQIPTE